MWHAVLQLSQLYGIIAFVAPRTQQQITSVFYFLYFNFSFARFLYIFRKLLAYYYHNILLSFSVYRNVSLIVLFRTFSYIFDFYDKAPTTLNPCLNNNNYGIIVLLLFIGTRSFLGKIFVF